MRDVVEGNGRCLIEFGSGCLAEYPEDSVRDMRQEFLDLQSEGDLTKVCNYSWLMSKLGRSDETTGAERDNDEDVLVCSGCAVCC